tara:strand:- start:40 stop:630 length:591 start_codon:yes stop_codon:yes gene_type:complete
MIALSGIAGSGKDLFCRLLLREISGQRIALADQLKEEVRPFIINRYSIDILNCSLEAKNKVRSFLVFHGGLKRFQSQGSHWTSIAQKKLDNCKSTPVVTDVRYDEYKDDEVDWVKQKNKGVLVHIRKYWETEGLFNMERHYFDPPNEDEKKNDPKLMSKADYCIEWPHIENATTKEIEDILRPFAIEFAEWYKKRS